MPEIIKAPGIREKIERDLIELNGFHEVTTQVYDALTQPEWQEILEKHLPDLDFHDKEIHVDLDKETIRLD